MTALRKFLPCDHEAQFHIERFDAFSTFIDALNAPIPLDVLAVMRYEDFLRSNSVYALRLLPQTLCQRGCENSARAIPRLTDGGSA